MSRASGAGAYSHGIAAPSPSPQLDAASDRAFCSPRSAVSSGVFVTIAAIIASRVSGTRQRGLRSGRILPAGGDLMLWIRDLLDGGRLHEPAPSPVRPP